jgi:hypothetical protein
MKKLLSFVLVLAVLAVIIQPAAPPVRAIDENTAEWSILWLIIPEIDVVPRGVTTRYRSTSSSATVNRARNLAVDFKRDVEAEIRALNGVNLSLIIDVVVSDIPLRGLNNGNSPSWYPTDQDLAPILDIYAPRRTGDYDSLIVMAEMTNLHNYGGLNWGWTSFCPLPYAVSNFLGYNIMLHEWAHHLEGIANGIAGSGRCPSPDGMQTGNYLEVYIRNKYPGLTGEPKNTKFLLELIAGTLPVNGNSISGFQIDYWNARPTLSRPKFEFIYTDSTGVKGRKEWLGGSLVVGTDAAFVITFSYDVAVARNMALDTLPDFRLINMNTIQVQNNRIVTIPLAGAAAGGVLQNGKSYYLNTWAFGGGFSTTHPYFNPNSIWRFDFSASNDPPRHNYGDVNNDGNINAADITLLRAYVAAQDKTAWLKANPNFIPERADANGDGFINSADITLIRRWVAAVNKSSVPLGIR